MKPLSQIRTTGVILLVQLAILFGTQVQAQTPEQMGSDRTQANVSTGGGNNGNIKYLGFGIASPMDDDNEMILGTGYTFFSGSKVPRGRPFTLGSEGQVTFYPGDSMVLTGYDPDYGYMTLPEISWWSLQAGLLVTGTFQPVPESPFFGFVGAGLSITTLFVSALDTTEHENQWNFMMSFGGGVELGAAAIQGRLNIIQDLNFLSLGVLFNL